MNKMKENNPMKNTMKKLTLTSFLAASTLCALALLLTGGTARAEIGPPVVCETTREGVSADLIALAADTRAAAEIVVAGERAGNVADKIARKLFWDLSAAELKSRGAAIDLLKAKNASAVDSINAYIDGWQKTKVTDAGLKQQFIDQATALIGCVAGVSGLPAVQ